MVFLSLPLFPRLDDFNFLFGRLRLIQLVWNIEVDMLMTSINELIGLIRVLHLVIHLSGTLYVTSQLLIIRLTEVRPTHLLPNLLELL